MINNNIHHKLQANNRVKYKNNNLRLKMINNKFNNNLKIEEN